MLLHGLITVSLVTALYTRLSEAASRGDHARGDALPPPGAAAAVGASSCPASCFVGVLAPYVASTLFFKNTLEETRAIAVVLAGLIWLVIPMAWTYLNDRVFYAHQMTWMTFRLQCVTTGLSTVGALVAATLDPSLTAFALSLGQVAGLRRHGARSGSACCAAGTATSGLRGAACDLPQARACPPLAHRPGPALAHPHLPPRPRRDPRRARAARSAALVLGVARGHPARPSPGAVAHALGRARDRRRPRADHASARAPLSLQCLLWAHTRRPRVEGAPARREHDEREEQR